MSNYSLSLKDSHYEVPMTLWVEQGAEIWEFDMSMWHYDVNKDVMWIKKDSTMGTLAALKGLVCDI